MRLGTGFETRQYQRPKSPVPIIQNYNFATNTPAAISYYTRGSTNEFYRNTSGKFVNAEAK